MPDLSDTVKQLIGQYHGLGNVRKAFDRDPSSNNIAIRQSIPKPDGTPALDLSPGLADQLLRGYESDNLSQLDQFATADAYKEFRKSHIDGLSENGQANAYNVLIKEHDDIRQKLVGSAIKRVATKNEVDKKLKEKDPAFDTKSEEDKLKAYVGVIEKDEKLAKKLEEDASYQVAKYLGIVYGLENMKDEDIPTKGIGIINEGLETNIASLLANEGQVSSVKALAAKVKKSLLEKSIKLIAENGYVGKDVDASLGNLDHGYARAIAEMAQIYEVDSEKAFRKGYEKAKTDGEVKDLGEYKVKKKEKAKVEEKKAMSLYKAA